MSLEFTTVATEDRCEVFPAIAGKQFMLYEQNLFHFADKFIDGYDGGYWDALHLDINHPELNKQSFILVPPCEDGELLTVNSPNGTTAKLPPIYAGIFLGKMLASNIAIHNYQKKIDNEKLNDYYQIMSLMIRRLEYSKISLERDFSKTLRQLLD